MFNLSQRWRHVTKHFAQLTRSIFLNRRSTVSGKHLEQAAPNDSESFYRQMFERNRAVKLVLDPENGQIIDANQAACDFYGYSSEQIKSMHISDINTLSITEIHDILQNAVAAKGANFQFQHRLASGVVRDVEVFAGLLDFNNKTYLYEIIQDITERKQAEKALRESEALYRLFAQNMPDSGVIMLDCDMRYTLAEGPFLKKFGLIFENVVGKTPQEALPTESVNFLLPVYERILRGESFSYERITDVFAYQSYATPVLDESGKIIGGMILSHDITETKRVEAALRASEERLRLIIDNIQDLVTYDDAKGNFVYVSPSAQSMLGYPPDALLKASSIELFHPDDHAAMIKILGNAMETHVPEFTVEGRIRHADGHYLNIETVGKLITDEQSNFTGGVFITRDITQRKHLQALAIEREKLHFALEKEYELNILKTRMMQRIAHEFRTPLAMIQASSETLASYWDRLREDQRSEKAAAINDQIRRLTTMLDEISQVVTSSFKSDNIQKIPTDVSILCVTVAQELERELNRPNKYILDLPQEIIASVDPIVLKKAIHEIMHNAAHFSEPSAPVHVSLSPAEKGFVLRVRDTGIGILPNEQQRIFEPFFRGSHIGETSGLGVGLTMTRAVIEAHGGTISIDSVPKQGTTVSVWIPV